MRPPWIRQTAKLFCEEVRGNSSEHHATYNDHTWRKVSRAFFKGRKCDIPNCITMAYCTDHIIPVRKEGSRWDRRNWQRLCKKHHDKKSSNEARGNVEPSIDTPHGKIPARCAHLPPDIANQSYLIK